LGQLARGRAQLHSAAVAHQPAGVEQHDLVPDAGKYMFHFIVVELVIFGKNLFKQRPKLGNIPLPVSQVIDKLPDRFLRRYLE